MGRCWPLGPLPSPRLLFFLDQFPSYSNHLAGKNYGFRLIRTTGEKGLKRREKQKMAKGPNRGGEAEGKAVPVGPLRHSGFFLTKRRLVLP